MNAKAEHTPGPWQVVPENQAVTRWIVGDVKGESIADCSPPGPWWNPEEADANANLIAAAPDLLKALEGVLRVADRKTDEFDAARVAIAKAKGETIVTVTFAVPERSKGESR